MDTINWGIIGCGDVTEIKSGPAFNKVADSFLVAVMRRDAAKAADYAKRHQVPKWYTDAAQLINDPEVNAIYIATPPATHEMYALQAINAGKPVYVEKPMALSYTAAKHMAAAAASKNVKLCVAHYRRQQPLFKKIKQLLDENTIGTVRLIQLSLYKTPFTAAQLSNPHFAWRVDPAVSGGGLFHDLAPHQLDILYYFFGPVQTVNGMSINQAGLYKADDLVTGNMLFKSGAAFSGTWCFTAEKSVDKCEIIGSGGSISFSMFDHAPIEVTVGADKYSFAFDALQHVQQPMIEEVVRFFLSKAPNPCSADEGAEVMRLMEGFIVTQ